MNYILQKDLPGTKAGMKFIKHEQEGGNTQYIAEDISTWYLADVVENTPEWFLPEEEKFIIHSLESAKDKLMWDRKGKYFYFLCVSKHCRPPGTRKKNSLNGWVFLLFIQD